MHAHMYVYVCVYILFYDTPPFHPFPPPPPRTNISREISTIPNIPKLPKVQKILNKSKEEDVSEFWGSEIPKLGSMSLEWVVIFIFESSE